MHLADSGGCGQSSAYTAWECKDRECNTVSCMDSRGRSKILNEDNYEKIVKRVTCKDLHGINNTFYKESERKSVTVGCGEEKGWRKPCRDRDCSRCVTQPSPGKQAGQRFKTKVSFRTP